MSKIKKIINLLFVLISQNNREEIRHSFVLIVLCVKAKYFLFHSLLFFILLLYYSGSKCTSFISRKRCCFAFGCPERLVKYS